jgi:hypothetical protein
VSKLDEMWAALEAHEPAPEYADAWATMCRERTYDAARAAYWAAPEESAARAAAIAARSVLVTAEAARDAAQAAAESADRYAQIAINAIKREVKP